MNMTTTGWARQELSTGEISLFYGDGLGTFLTGSCDGGAVTVEGILRDRGGRGQVVLRARWIRSTRVTEIWTLDPYGMDQRRWLLWIGTLLAVPLRLLIVELGMDDGLGDGVDPVDGLDDPVHVGLIPSPAEDMLRDIEANAELDHGLAEGAFGARLTAVPFPQLFDWDTPEDMVKDMLGEEYEEGVASGYAGFCVSVALDAVMAAQAWARGELADPESELAQLFESYRRRLLTELIDSAREIVERNDLLFIGTDLDAVDCEVDMRVDDAPRRVALPLVRGFLRSYFNERWAAAQSGV